jgi:DNA-binding FrmR family transcriptional regulator
LRRHILRAKVHCIAVLALSFFPSQLPALDCEFAIFLYERSKASCDAGEADACASVTVYKPNADKCPRLQPENSAPVGAATTESMPPDQAETKPESDPFVEEIQTLLTVAGFNPGGIDGKLGPGTCSAAERFAQVRKLSVGCDNLVALRAALMQDVLETSIDLAGCGLLQQLPEDVVTAAWRSRTQTRIRELDNHLRDLTLLDAQLKGDLQTLTGARASISATLQTTVSVAKFSLGKAAVLSFAMGQLPTGATLLTALAVLQTAEALKDDLGRAIDLYIDGKLETFRSDLVRGLKEIEGSIDGLLAMLEAAQEMEASLNQQQGVRAAAAEISAKIDVLRRQTWSVRQELKSDRSYSSFLAAVSEARVLCLKQARP